MKKLFMLLVAMIMVSMSFAQMNEYQVVNMPGNNEQLRSDWFGWYQSSQTVSVLPAETEYLLRIPAGSFSGSITQVKFVHTTSDNISGYTGAAFNNETYTIKIYTNAQWSQVTYMGSDNQEHTYDTIDPGTLATSFTYSPTEPGIQDVTLTTPFQITSAMGDVCVAIYAPEMSALGICVEDDECEHLNFFNKNDGDGWWHPRFGNENVGYTNKPFLLGVYFDDGGVYQPKCDFRTCIHDPSDEATYPDCVEEILVDNYTDSLELAFEIGNYGPDDAYGSLVYTVSVEYNGNNTVVFEDDQWNFAEITNDGYLGVNYGFWSASYGPIMGLPAEGVEGPTDFDNLGLGWPFQLCVHVDFFSTNGATDPAMDNNTYCVWVHNTDVESGIQNAANNSLRISPNPASTEITVENAAGSQIFVYNIAGQEVMSVENAEANETLNVSNLTAGLYIVRVINGSEVSSAKVSIVR